MERRAQIALAVIEESRMSRVCLCRTDLEEDKVIEDIREKIGKTLNLSPDAIAQIKRRVIDLRPCLTSERLFRIIEEESRRE